MSQDANTSLARRDDQPVLTLTSARKLRPFLESDLTQLVKAASDPEIRQWHKTDLSTRQQARLWIERSHDLWQQGTRVYWAIVEPSGRDLSGRVGLKEIDLVTGQAEISYWISPLYRRRGIATEAVDRVARWGLNELGLRRIELKHSVKNLTSCKVAKAAGFHLEETVLHSGRHPDGLHDMHLHARLFS